MEFHTTESQTMIAQAVRDLCEREVRPNVMEWDEANTSPRNYSPSTSVRPVCWVCSCRRNMEAPA
jgi:alkylation response protein AidB-like acyl-CoA dehydrogenase